MKALIHATGRAYQRKVLQSEYEAQKFFRHNERPMEFGFVFKQIGRFAPETILDIGTGTTALPALMANCGAVVTAIDNIRDYWPEGMINRHWHILDDDIQAMKLTEKSDLVTCISTLEHIKNYDAAVRSMLGLVKSGGHLVITGPYTDAFHVDDCYRVPGADAGLAAEPYIGNSYSGEDLKRWLGFGGELIEAEYWKGFSGKHWALGERIAPPRPATVADGNHACLLIRRT
jgi:SAM-dependent methyltransferase